MVWYGRLLRSASASRVWFSRWRRVSPTSLRRDAMSVRSSFWRAVSVAVLALNVSLMLPVARILALSSF